MSVTFTLNGITPSNKTEKYLLQLSARAYGYKNNKGKTVSILYPVIDKLSFTIPVDEEDHNTFDEILMDIHKIDEEFSSVSAKDKKYKINTEWTDTETGQKVLIQCKPVKAKYNYMRVELNPSLLGPKGMSRFKHMFEFNVAVGSYPYSDILEKGRITRADIAVDIISAPAHEFIVSGSGKGKTIKYLGVETHNMETTYLDKPKSNPSYKKVYNKLQHQIDKGIDLSFNGVFLTRVEYKHSKSEFGKLNTIHNPFKKMNICHPIYMPDGMDSWVWELFLNSCRHKGIQSSLDLLPNELKAPSKEALEKAAVETWRPEKLWEKWDNYLIKSGVLTLD